ncbi:hypothetical protein M0813_04020 [Anaeramoeba flamelloides]|uniref:Uncharacterized protein n=1 Tax=Anaeramoeba flamelloides TaxID=1746091 RepID=A0ABQ8XNN1_9EUKA|nr:hypothetical protein M0813_04020 [Anaeramoeba flamelloides]
MDSFHANEKFVKNPCSLINKNKKKEKGVYKKSKIIVKAVVKSKQETRGRPRINISQVKKPIRSIHNILNKSKLKKEKTEIVSFVKKKVQENQIYQKEVETFEYCHEIIVSFRNVLNELPKNSPIRRPLLGLIYKKLITKNDNLFISLFGISQRTLDRIKIELNELNILENIKYSIISKKKKIKKSEIEIIRKYWLEETPPDSDERNEVLSDEEIISNSKFCKKKKKVLRHPQRKTDSKIIKAIQLKFSKVRINKFQKTTLRKYKPKRIRKIKYFRCTDTSYCKHCEQSTEGHKEFVNHQRENYLNKLKNPKENEENGQFSNLNEITFFSDNGNHFKNKKTLFFFSEIAEKLQIQIIHNFFVAHHGANICDSHFGLVKQTENRLKNINMIPVTCDDYSNLVENLSQTNGILLNVTTSPQYSNILPLKGVRKIHQIQYLSSGKIKFRNKSNFGEWTNYTFKNKN